MKTNKSFTKRIKVTKTGKALARKAGTNHFLAKQSRSNQLAGNRPNQFIITAKSGSRFLPNVKFHTKIKK